MDYCTRCGGTGQEVNGKYCTCKEGRLKKALESAGQKAAQKAADEIVKQAKETTPETVKKKKKKEPPKQRPAIDYQPGDWVTINNYNRDLNGTLCEVVAIDAGDDDIKVLARGKNRKGIEMKGTTWLHTSYVRPAPVELDKHQMARLRDCYINMAIDTKDQKWLEELKDFGR